MKQYEYTALIEVSLIIQAENQTDADRQVKKYSAEGWIRNGEVIGFSDVDLINEGEVRE